VVFIVKGFLSF